MKYAFIKRFNPAYDFFLTRYFSQSGIDFDERALFTMASAIADELRRKALIHDNSKPSNSESFRFREYLPAHEALFWNYVKRWGAHPECRPALYDLLDKMLGGKGVPELEKMRELESQLPPSGGKLVFSEEEVASSISEFYKNYLRLPLKMDMERGAVGRELAKYFSSQEFTQLPDVRVVGLQKVEEVTHRIAGDLLGWFGKIADERVLSDMGRVLRDHQSQNHSREITSALSGPLKKLRVCEHLSGTVRLNGYHDLDTNVASEFLQPIRGFGITNDTIEEGWNEVAFPSYHAVKEQSIAPRLANICL